MSSTVVTKEKNVLEVTVQVSAEALQEAMKTAYKKQAQRFSIPGFRKGKAPYAMVTRYYGEGVFYEGAIDLLSNDAYKTALEENKLEPAARPEMDIRSIDSQTGVEFVFTVTTKPEVKLGEYKGVEAKRPLAQVDEDELALELKRMQEKNARMLEVEDRAAEKGDIVSLNFEGFVDEVPFNGGKGENYDLELGSGTFIPGFEDQVVGHKTGETFDVNVVFPTDYGSQELAGKEARFVCSINKIKFKELPVLDDEFAKDVSEFDTLTEYKESLKSKLLEAKEKRAKETYEDNVIKAVVENAELEVPQAMILEEVDRLVDRQAQMMKYQGIQLEQYLMYLGKTLEEFKKGFEEQASINIKTRLVLEAVKLAEDFEVSENDYELEYANMAQQYKKTVEEIKQLFESQKDYIKESILAQKTISFLVENAKPIEE